MAGTFAFGTRHVVSQLKGDNAVLNGLIGVCVGIEETVPKRIRLMLNENKIPRETGEAVSCSGFPSDGAAISPHDAPSKHRCCGVSSSCAGEKRILRLPSAATEHATGRETTSEKESCGTAT